MRLFINDKIPSDISLKDAYSKIRKWYKANIGQIESKNDEFSIPSAALINALPPANKISDLEIMAIFADILYGNLEWAYHENDGEYKMGAYAHGAMETAGLPMWSASDDEVNRLKGSPLWQHLMICQRLELDK